MSKSIARVVLGLVALGFCVLFPGWAWLDAGSARVHAAGQKTDEIRGELEVIVEDSKADWHTHYYLKTAGGKLELHFAKDSQQNLRTGRQVRARGVRTGNYLSVDSLVTEDLGGSSATNFQTESMAALPNTTGEHKVLVILVNFQDLATQPYTVADAQDVAFNQTSNFYRENSYGQTWLTGDVRGWYTIPVSSTNCDTTAIAAYAQQAAAKGGANLGAYNHLVYAFPNTSACGFTGQGTIGGSPSEAWINGWFEVGSVGHELGHNFGLYHSRSMDCGAAVIGGTCTSIEYGDVFDIMGQGSTTHFNPYQKERLGWLNNSSSPPIQTVSSSGTYWIDAYETPGSVAKAIKILKSTDATTGLKTWYYLDHRTPTGFDAYLANWGAQVNGIGLRTGSESNPQDTYLLDTTPSTDTWNDAMLVAGQSFTDASIGLTVTTVSADATGAWVQITMNAQPCVHVNPTVAVSPAQTGWLLSGTAYSYTLTVTNNDSSTCSASDFSAAASVPAGWSANPVILNLAPGVSGSTPIVVTSPVGTADGNYGVGLAATNASDATRTASASTTYTIASKLNVVDTPNASKYTRTQKASVKATVSLLGSMVANAPVTFTMTKPDGSVVTQTGTTGSTGTASFTYAFNRRTDPIGTYQVMSVSSANGLSGQGSTSFIVTK